MTPVSRFVLARITASFRPLRHAECLCRGAAIWRFVVIVGGVLLGSVLALQSVSIAGDDWNQWRGSERNGSVAGADWPTQLEGKLEKVWEHKLSPSYSGPVVQDGKVFTTETIDRTTERVTAYDLASGGQLWTQEWPGSLSVPFFAAANGDWIRSTPVSAPGSLVVLGMRDRLVHLDTETGDVRWDIDFPEKFKTPLQPFGAVCSPLIHDNAVFVQLGGGLTKVDLTSGEVRWTVLGGGGDMSSTGAFSSPTVATLCGVEQLLVQTREKLCGVALDSGEVLWSEPIEAFRGMNILTPLAIGDSVFTAAHSGVSQLFDISREQDQWRVSERWAQKTQGYMSSPVHVDDFIYLHLKNERVACLSIAEGTIEWTSPPVGKYWSMAHDGAHILSLASDGVLRLLDATPEKYTVIDQTKVADDSWAHVAVQDNLVIIRALDRLTAYRWDK